MREGAWQAAFAVSACDLQSIVGNASRSCNTGLAWELTTLPCDHSSCPPPPVSHFSPRSSWRQHIVSLTVCSHYKCFTCHRLTALQLQPLLQLQLPFAIFYFPFSIFHLQYECVGVWERWGEGRALCNGTQSDNWRLRIFAFCVNFHGKIIDALPGQGFSMAAYLLKLWFLARFAARCSLLFAACKIWSNAWKKH